MKDRSTGGEPRRAARRRVARRPANMRRCAADGRLWPGAPAATDRHRRSGDAAAARAADGSARSGPPAPNIAQGYWRNPRRPRRRSGARIAGEDERSWLRTGDLGFLDEDSELFITGRIKEVIIIRGINHYPQDIEDTVQACHPALRPHGGAAFAARTRRGEQLVVVQEVERTFAQPDRPDALAGRIRDAVVREHDDRAARDRADLRPGALPKPRAARSSAASARSSGCSRLESSDRIDRLAAA